MLINANAHLLFIGDSITDAGRNAGGDLTPWDWGSSLGKGYVAQVEALLTNLHGHRQIRVGNVGCSGNTVRDLHKRWDTDVIARKPTWLSVMIGINDVWRQFDSPNVPERGVPLDEYSTTLDVLLARTRGQLDGLILASPYMIEPLKADTMRVRMEQYAAVVKTLAAKHNAIFVDSQAVMDDLCTHRHSMAYSWDRIHGNPAVNMGLALAVCRAIGAFGAR